MKVFVVVLSSVFYGVCITVRKVLKRKTNTVEHCPTLDIIANILIS